MEKIDEISLQLKIKQKELKEISKESDVLLEERKTEMSVHKLKVEEIDNAFFNLEKRAFNIITSIYTGSKIAYLISKKNKKYLYESGYFGGIYRSNVLTLYRFEVLDKKKRIIYKTTLSIESALKHFKKIN